MVRPPKFDPDIEYYTVLRVARDATDTQIKDAYKQWCKILHPDRYCSNEKDFNATTRFFQQLQEAFDVLKDSTKRRVYDAFLSQDSNGQVMERRANNDFFKSRVIFPFSMWCNLEKRLGNSGDEKSLGEGTEINLFAQEMNNFHLFLGLRVKDKERNEYATRKLLEAHPDFVLVPCLVRPNGLRRGDADKMIKAYEDDKTGRSVNSVFLMKDKIVLYRIKSAEDKKFQMADINHPGTMLSINYSKECDKWRKEIAKMADNEYQHYFNNC